MVQLECKTLRRLTKTFQNYAFQEIYFPYVLSCSTLTSRLSIKIVRVSLQLQMFNHSFATTLAHLLVDFEEIMQDDLEVMLGLFGRVLKTCGGDNSQWIDLAKVLLDLDFEVVEHCRVGVSSRVTSSHRSNRIRL